MRRPNHLLRGFLLLSISCSLTNLAWAHAIVVESTPKVNDVIPRQPSPDSLWTTIPELDPGNYRLHWQVLAGDGHITQGDIPFTVAPH